jgi:hypothetical protein
MITFNCNKYTYTNKTTFSGSFLQRKCGSFFEKEISPYALNIANYGSKVLISPLMILLIAPFTKDWKKDKTRESIKCSALLHPIQAAVTFLFATAASFTANKLTDKYAQKGVLGSFIDPELGKFFDPVKNPHNLAKLKNINTIILTLAMIPIVSVALDWIIPKILRKNNQPLNLLDKITDSACTATLFPEFGNKKKLKGGKLYA